MVNSVSSPAELLQLRKTLCSEIRLLCLFIFSFYGNYSDAVMLWAYVCSCVSVCPPFANNSWPFSAQFHLKLVVSVILGAYIFPENRQLHIAEGKPTALYGRKCVSLTQAMLGIKAPTQESNVLCPNLMKSFNQRWHHQRIPSWDETRFHLLCGIWKYLITQESKKLILILSPTLACSLALLLLLQACNIEPDPVWPGRKGW